MTADKARHVDDVIEPAPDYRLRTDAHHWARTVIALMVFKLTAFGVLPTLPQSRMPVLSQFASG